MIIAIDGTAGTGKGTISKLVSERLGFVYVDTGAMYRALTLKFIREHISLDDIGKIQEILKSTSISFNKQQEVLLDGENVNAEIRAPEISELVPKVSSIPIVREKLVEEQRKLGNQSNIIMEN